MQLFLSQLFLAQPELAQSLELALVLTEHFIEPIQLTNSRKMFCFLCQVKSNEPQSHQLRKCRKGQGRLVVVSHTMGLALLLKSLILDMLQNTCVY